MVDNIIIMCQIKIWILNKYSYKSCQFELKKVITSLGAKNIVYLLCGKEWVISRVKTLCQKSECFAMICTQYT